MQEAIKLLYENLLESKSIAESISQSQIGGMRSARGRANSEFDQLGKIGGAAAMHKSPAPASAPGVPRVFDPSFMAAFQKQNDE